MEKTKQEESISASPPNAAPTPPEFAKENQFGRPQTETQAAAQDNPQPDFQYGPHCVPDGPAPGLHYGPHCAPPEADHAAAKTQTMPPGTPYGPNYGPPHVSPSGAPYTLAELLGINFGAQFAPPGMAYAQYGPPQTPPTGAKDSTPGRGPGGSRNAFRSAFHSWVSASGNGLRPVWPILPSSGSALGYTAIWRKS